MTTQAGVMKGNYRKTAVSAKKKPSAVAVRRSRAFCLVLLAGAFCLMIVVMAATAANLRRLNNDLENENAYIQAEIDSLEIQITDSTSINRIEEVATQELGMVHPSASNLITLTDDAEDTKNLAATIKEEAYD